MSRPPRFFPKEVTDLKVGQRVRHPIDGVGTVTYYDYDDVTAIRFDYWGEQVFYTDEITTLEVLS